MARASCPSRLARVAATVPTGLAAWITPMTLPCLSLIGSVRTANWSWEMVTVDWVRVPCLAAWIGSWLGSCSRPFSWGEFSTTVGSPFLLVWITKTKVSAREGSAAGP